MSEIQDEVVATYDVQIIDLSTVIEYYGRFHPILTTGIVMDLNSTDQEVVVIALATAVPPPVMAPTNSSAIIASLKRVCADELSDEYTDEVCSICLETWAKEQVLVCLPCKHVFHEECISKWFNTRHICPLCRFELPSNTQDC